MRSRNRCPNGDREGGSPQRARRCLSAWRRRRETHSRTPYPSPNPTIIAISALGVAPTSQVAALTPRALRWNRPASRETIKSHLAYVNLTDAFFKQMFYRFSKDCCEKGTPRRRTATRRYARLLWPRATLERSRRPSGIWPKKGLPHGVKPNLRLVDRISPFGHRFRLRIHGPIRPDGTCAASADYPAVACL